MKPVHVKIVLIVVFTAFLLNVSEKSWGWGLASNNIPLDSPVYFYLEKLAGYGLITTDFRGIRPFSKAEAVRLVLEAEKNLQNYPASTDTGMTDSLIYELRQILAREIALYKEPAKAPWFDVNPLSSARVRYVYLDGIPRSYERPVHDPGGDRLFGITDTLRPDNPYPSPVQQRGTEGTPLLENNEGIRYERGSNYEIRFSSEAYAGRYATALIEPLFISSEQSGDSRLLLNKGYVKLGGGGLEVEVGRDANWLGLGFRGNVILTNNARNFDLIKLSSPEPISLKYLGDIKYAFIFSRFDKTDINGNERQPYFVGAKFSIKPWENFEAGINLGRQQGGTGVDNSLGSWLRGIYGGTNDDNSNSIAGFEFRYRLPFLRNMEIYGEDSFEDLPSAESYVAGVYIPRLTDSGKDDLRFEYFWGHQILYTNGTFPEGYLYQGMPIGHSQGGATEDFFVRYSHWFSPRNRLALEYFHTERGNLGRVTVNSAGQFDPTGVKQSVERKNAWRAFWNLPLYGDVNMEMMYGWERINNFNLVGGVDQTNQIFKIDVSYRY